MKTTLHKADTRGSADHGWLKANHTFSFASYQDPERMGFGVLRVINDDVIHPSMGFATHPHNDMEIISVPISGALKHKDTMGNEFVIRKGEIQTMSAGTGIQHSEYNNSPQENTNLLQIWVHPRATGLEPRYSQKEYSASDRDNKFQLIVSPDGRDNSNPIYQDAFFSLANLSAASELNYEKYKVDNGLYLFVISGDVDVNGTELNARDGLGIEDFDSLKITASKDAELLLMEVPMNN